MPASGGWRLDPAPAVRRAAVPEVPVAHPLGSPRLALSIVQLRPYWQLGPAAALEGAL